MTTTAVPAAELTGAAPPPRVIGGVRGVLPLLGPAFVAAVAYVDPGNVATNFSAGAAYGYRLLWVVVAANLMAVLVQLLTAKLGLATGRDLATLCRERLPRPLGRVMWLQAELVAMATDLAEIVGGAVALHLLFGIPLVHGAVITGVSAFAVLHFASSRRKKLERVIGAMLLVVGIGFGYVVVRSGLDLGSALSGLTPSLGDGDQVALAAGILGATLMPHVVYVHSAMAAGRYGETESLARTSSGRGRLLRVQRIDVLVALGLAGLINAAMLVASAQLFFGQPVTATLQGIHDGLGHTLGSVAAAAFAIALLASGLASSSVGTQAGEIVMAGFLQRRIPLAFRRAVTMLPALAVVMVGVEPTRALVWSQVVLSFGIPFVLMPLLYFTARSDVMGLWRNRIVTTVAGAAIALVVICLNASLLYGVFFGS